MKDTLYRSRYKKIFDVFKDYSTLVKNNQKIVDYCKKRPHENVDDQMLNISTDIAIARLNTILIRLVQHPLEADIHHKDIIECQSAIDDFYYYILKIDTWPKITRWFWRWKLHRTGKNKIPKIKKLLQKLNKDI